jgi:hypothetical protein
MPDASRLPRVDDGDSASALLFSVRMHAIASAAKSQLEKGAT